MSKKHPPSGVGKIPTGISGFDQLTGGGLAAKRTTLVLGAPGTGKTVFALQTLVNGARRGEPGIFVSFGERAPRLVENAAAFGWDLPALEKARLVLLDARVGAGGVNEGHADLPEMLAAMTAVTRELGAKRIVFDSLEVLFALLDDSHPQLQNALRLRDWLFENEMTALLTASLQGAEPGLACRYAFMQLIADCAVDLEYRVQESCRFLRLVKYRGSGFVERAFPFVIGNSGIEVLLPRELETTPRSDAAAALGQELLEARGQLTARIQAMDRFLEMKQAELDFLIEKGSPSVRPQEQAPAPEKRRDSPDIRT